MPGAGLRHALRKERRGKGLSNRQGQRGDGGTPAVAGSRTGRAFRRMPLRPTGIMNEAAAIAAQLSSARVWMASPVMLLPDSASPRGAQV